MGLSGISPGSLLLLLLIILLFGGGSRLRTLGEDLGMALKSFKKAFEEEPPQKKDEL
jgi:sec-independent protein translocase protein TatA